LTDLLDVIVINLKEAERKEELGNGSLYTKVQKKMTSTMLANYNRWWFEQKKMVKLLRHFVSGSCKKLNFRLLWQRHYVG